MNMHAAAEHPRRRGLQRHPADLARRGGGARRGRARGTDRRDTLSAFRVLAGKAGSISPPRRPRPAVREVLASLSAHRSPSRRNVWPTSAR